MINNLNWTEVIFFFDVDDTLIDTTSNSVIASEGIADVLKQEYGEEKSILIKNRFNQIFETLMQEHMTTGRNNVEQYNFTTYESDMKLNNINTYNIQQYNIQHNFI